MKTNKLLATVVVLQGLILIGQWTGGGAGALPAASAQIPDPANRQMQMIEQLSQINGKLDAIVDVLRNGEVQVKVPKAEENKGNAAKK
jgi:hypothetical protein